MPPVDDIARVEAHNRAPPEIPEQSARLPRRQDAALKSGRAFLNHEHIAADNDVAALDELSHTRVVTTVGTEPLHRGPLEIDPLDSRDVHDAVRPRILRGPQTNPL